MVRFSLCNIWYIYLSIIYYQKQKLKGTLEIIKHLALFPHFSAEEIDNKQCSCVGLVWLND